MVNDVHGLVIFYNEGNKVICGVSPMQETLLTTKLNLPTLQPNWLCRPRLLESLNEGLARRLTLVCAPAGYGKTGLLSEWARNAPAKAIWISLDEGDNDIARFFRYLVASVQSISPGGGQTPASLVGIVNDLAMLQQSLIIILDDYQVIQAESVHQAMAWLLDHLPPMVHVVIATRADPPLPLSRLRARGSLAELRARDLRFSLEEVAAYFESLALALEPNQVAALTSRTEGWAAGLQLAALSMRGRDNVAEFIEAFAGRHEYIADYLADEVLRQQPEERTAFLLQTSILERMCASLCQAVVDSSGEAYPPAHWQEQLVHLQQQNLFVVPLDDERLWYRYHRLLADVLRQRLQEKSPHLVPELHRRASRWFEDHGLAGEAIHHALAAKDLERVAGLVETAGPLYLRRSEVATVLGWLGALPEEWLERRPSLALTAVLADINAGRLDGAERRIARIDEERLPPLLRSVAWVARTQLCWFKGDLKGVSEFSEQILASVQGTSSTHEPDRTSGAIQELLAATFLAEASRALGNTARAMEACCRTIARTDGIHAGSDSAAFLGNLKLKVSLLLYERNDLAAAERYAAEGLDLVSRAGHTLFEASAYATLASIRRALGEGSAAQELLQRAVAIVRKRCVAHELAAYAAIEARQHLQMGMIQEAVQWSERQLRDIDLAHQAGLEVEQIRFYTEATRIRIFLARGLYTEARAQCEHLLEKALADERVGNCIELHALLALAARGQGDSAGALRALDHALRLARAEGYVRTFLDEGKPMQMVLAELHSRFPSTSPSADYAGRLLQAIGTETDHPATNAHLAEPLSDRELEVLRLLGEGRLNREIADQLVITVGTVKRHVNSICGKLAAEGRRDAVSKATALHLLP